MEQRSGEQGFTIVELMIVVAIIAVLAAIVVPTFTTESKKSKAKSEAAAMFAEIGVRQEQYKLENGAYLEAAACPPGTPASTPRDITSCIASSQPWETLRIHAPSVGTSANAAPSLYCTYEVVTNTSATTDPPSWVTTGTPNSMWNPPANTSWYFVVATCDMDNNGVTSQYFQGSVNSRIEKHNDGN